MQRLIEWVIHKSPWVALVLLLVTIAAALQMPNLRLEISAEGMMVKDDPARLAYEQSLDTFGVDNVTIVYLEDDELFSADNLRAIKKVVQVIESSDLVSHTESLFSIRHLRMEGEFLYTDAYLAKIPESAEAITAVRQAAFGNPLIADNLLSADGRVMAINISLNSQLREAGFDEAVAAFLNDTLGPLENRLERVFFLGDPSVRVGINDRIHEDQKSILPISLAILIVTLAITLRRISGALIPLMTASLSVIWTLGLMAALDIPLNVMTSIVPALLIIIGSTEDIHLLSEYLVGINKQYDKPKALKLMSRNMSMAVLLTFITTYFGFLSIALNSLDILQQFGLVASTGLLLNFLITISLVPLALKWFGSNRPGKPIHDAGWLFTRISLGMLNLVERFRYAVVGFLTVVFLIGAYGATQVNVNNNVMDYFKDDSALAKKAQLLHDNLAGMQTFSIILSGTEDTFTRISRLDEIWELQEYIAVAPGLDKSVSFADFLAVIHTGLDGEGDGELYLPDEDAVVMEYMALVDKDAASSLVSENFSQARITVRHNIDSSMELNRAVEGIYAAAEELISEGVRVSVTGESYLSSMAVDYIADGQVRSLLMMLLVIFGIVAFLFMNPKAGWVAVVANAFPIVMLFGFMGYAGLSMDTGTAMVGAISLGICVDHTMHFMVRYNRASKSLGSEYMALKQTMLDESTPIFATALALALGFGALMISEFPPVAEFGLLSAMVMLMALISTFLITPLMLRHVRLLTVWDLLSVKVRKGVLQDSPMFKDMSNWQIRKILALSKIERFKKDEVILRQAEEPQGMFVMLEGKAETWRTRSDGSSYRVNEMKSGEVFGITSAATNRKRFADVVATDTVSVLSMRWEDIRRIRRIFPYIASRLYENLLQIVGELVVDIESRRPEIRDELSGAYNKTYFNDLVDFAVKLSSRHKESLTVMIVDVLHHDHQNGIPGANANWILRETAEAIQMHIRGGDVYARWQGNRFLVLLPHTSLDQAEVLSRRIRASLDDPNLMTPESADISIKSVAMVEQEDPEDFLERVDQVPAEKA